MQVESPSHCVRWSLLRVAPGHDVVVELLSGDWIRLATHYVGRTVLCPEVDECELCDLLPVRAFWYLPAVVEPGRRPCLLELSSCASSDLEQVAKFAFGALRAGCQFRLSRRSAKKAVRAEALEFSAPRREPEFAEWASCLMAIFGLAAVEPGELLPEYGLRMRERVVRRASMYAEQIRHGTKGRV